VKVPISNRPSAANAKPSIPVIRLKLANSRCRAGALRACDGSALCQMPEAGGTRCCARAGSGHAAKSVSVAATTVVRLAVSLVAMGMASTAVRSLPQSDIVQDHNAQRRRRVPAIRTEIARRNVGLRAATIPSPLLRLAHDRTPTVIFVTVHAALRIFLGHAFTLWIMVHSLTRAMMVPLSFW